MEVIARLPVAAKRLAYEMLEPCRQLFPQVHFFIDPCPTTKLQVAVFAQVLDGTRPDLRPLTKWFQILTERELWKRHALEVTAVKDAVAVAAWKSGRAQDADWSVIRAHRLPYMLQLIALDPEPIE